MEIQFFVKSFTYDKTNDTLTTVVQRCDEPHETYKITAELSFRRNTIEDVSEGEIGDVEPQYPSQILCAFMTTFADAYCGFNHPDVPIDVVFVVNAI